MGMFLRLVCQRALPTLAKATQISTTQCYIQIDCVDHSDPLGLEQDTVAFGETCIKENRLWKRYYRAVD